MNLGVKYSPRKLESCYLCGSMKNITKDHIPPKNLYPPPRPSSLATISCCRKCNEKYSLIDESFRVFVSSTINRSKAGQWIWDNKVMNSSFRRSPKLKIATRNSLVPVKELIRGQAVTVTGMTYPIKKAKKYLIRLTKGFTRYFHPEIDYSNTKFKVEMIIPNQKIVNMLYQKFFYTEVGDGVFRMWRIFVKGHEPNSFWIFVFYDDLMFMVEMNKRKTS